VSLNDQLIEFARERKRKCRRSSVHKSVSHPIIVLVIGDKQHDHLDTIYTQLSSRWSSQLKALQICYCYINTPYTGSAPILQVKLKQVDKGGAGALCALSDTLTEVNQMMDKAIDQISKEHQVQLMQASVHIILAPEDPEGALLSDLAAVAKGRLEDFGVVTNDCKLYLLLPKIYRTEDECARVCGVMEQLREARTYEHAVLQPQLDAAPRVCRIERLINSVMLLDDLNENYQPYNVHGERLGLLLDLVENGWSNTGFIQTSGVCDGSVGPEYWLSQAADELCSTLQEQPVRAGDDKRFQAITGEITSAAQIRRRSMEKAVRACCLFLPGRVGRIARLSLEEGETAVFGGALRAACMSWRKDLTELDLPDAVLRTVESIESVTEVDELADQLEDWVDGLEKQPVPPEVNYCPQFSTDKGEADAAMQFRSFLWAKKYLPLAEQEERSCCADLARLCVKSCRERKGDLQAEEEDFAEFAKEIHEAWTALRDGYNDGGRLELKWIAKRPAPEALHKAGALAIRTEDASKALSMIADCVDLDGPDSESVQRDDPPLFCRIHFTAELNTRVQPITQGVSAGRVLKFAVISQEYDEEMLQRVHALNYAWKNKPD